jgi:hypothetical protein
MIIVPRINRQNRRNINPSFHGSPFSEEREPNPIFIHSNPREINSFLSPSHLDEYRNGEHLHVASKREPNHLSLELASEKPFMQSQIENYVEENGQVLKHDKTIVTNNNGNETIKKYIYPTSSRYENDPDRNTFFYVSPQKKKRASKKKKKTSSKKKKRASKSLRKK